MLLTAGILVVLSVPMLAYRADKATSEACVPCKTEPEAKCTCVTSLLEREVEWSKVGEEQGQITDEVLRGHHYTPRFLTATAQ